MDYGLTEFVESDLSRKIECPPGEYAAEIVSSSLHNYVMPLLRYRSGDLVRINPQAVPCPCGRGFPVISGIIGRSSDVIFTPDRRAVTALYTVFEGVPGLLAGRIVQERLDELMVEYACPGEREEEVRELLRGKLIGFVGVEMKIHFLRRDLEELHEDCARKFKNVVSRLEPEGVL